MNNEDRDYIYKWCVKSGNRSPDGVLDYVRDNYLDGRYLRFANVRFNGRVHCLVSSVIIQSRCEEDEDESLRLLVSGFHLKADIYFSLKNNAVGVIYDRFPCGDCATLVDLVRHIRSLKAFENDCHEVHRVNNLNAQEYFLTNTLKNGVLNKAGSNNNFREAANVTNNQFFDNFVTFAKSLSLYCRSL